MKNVTGVSFKILGLIFGIILGLWGLTLAVAVTNEVASFLGVVLKIMLLPFVLGAAPLYIGVTWGNWLPLIVFFGGGVVAIILYGLSLIIEGKLKNS